MLALVASLITSLAGSVLVWSVYTRAFRGGIADDRPAAGEATAPLILGVARTPGGPGEWVAYAAAFAQLERDLGQPVTVRYGLDRVALSSLIETGSVDVALVSIYTYLDLQQRGLASVVAAPIVSGRTKDAAVMVVASQGGIDTLDALRGSRLVLMDQSLASESFAQWLFESRGEALDDFFGSIEYNESQDANLSLVASGKAAVAGVNRSALATWPEGTFRVVAESPEFGMPPVIARSDLDPTVLDRVRRSLLGVAGKGVLPTVSRLDGFAAAADADYDFSRTLREYSGASGPSSPTGSGQ